MMTRDIQLQRLDEPQRKIAAWYLLGEDAAGWLVELSRWEGVQGELRIYPVPRTRQDPRTTGLLVIPPEGARPPAGWRALALGVMEGRLFLPIDAILFPSVTPAEVRALCRAEVTLFHPGLGVVEFSVSDRKAVWDLIEPPTLVSANWNAARSGSKLSSRLRGVALLALPQGDEIFGDAEKEIGTEPPTKLPPRKKEPSPGPAGKMGRGVAGFVAGVVQKILSWLPGPAKSPGSSGKTPQRTWMNDAMDWAAAKLARISRDIEELRHRELHRLMEMLNSDPERGLRHALPLGGSEGRGRAAPGAHLGNRDLRFRVGGSNPGGPVDPWDVPMELRQKLIARYRELALREKQLGRFQRAAYIYAELLGDWSAAAAVLKEGLHFAEAGVVFRDRLNQPRAAAECFAAGGLFAEAIAIYEKEKLFLELGDLHRKLGDEEAAATAYWRVVEEKTAAGDFLGAAALLEERLHLPDKALILLGKAWPGAPQAAQCLTAQFALMGRLGLHEAAHRRVAELRDEATPTHQVIPLAEVLSAVRKTYPDATFRPFAADVVRRKVSGRLAAGDASEARAGTRILSELAPEDRLLARDASRFLATRLEMLARRTPPALPPPLPPPRKAGSNRVGKPIPAGEFRLRKSARVLAVKRCGLDFVAALLQNTHIVILRGDWTGIVQWDGWNTESVADRQVSLVLDEEAGQPDHLFIVDRLRLASRLRLAATDRFRGALPLGLPPWFPNDATHLAVSGPHRWVLRPSAGELIVEIRGEDGTLIGGFSLSKALEEIEEPVENVCLLAWRSQLWISFGRHLFLFGSSGKSFRRWKCESAIIGLESSAPFLANAIVARCDQGAAFFWCNHLGDQVEMLATEIGAPFAACLGNGMLVLLSSRAGPGGFVGQVIDPARRGIHSRAEFFWEGEEPAGLVACARQDQFAIFTRSGEVHLHRVPTIA